MNIIFINSHPIQYFAPLYQAIAKDDQIDLHVIYLSDETIHGYKDIQFGVNVKWDIPLLEGYRYMFVKNNSLRPSINNGFFGLMNFGLIKELQRKKKKSLVIVHGWAYFSNILAVYAAKSFGHTVCLRGETPLKQENAKSMAARFGKFLFFKLFLFPFVDKFLFIGQQNRLFYKHLGIKDKDLIFTPYSVDNDRFKKDFLHLRRNKHSIKAGFDFSEEDQIILFAGKFITKKLPLDLLKAFLPFKNKNVKLIMMGEGELRADMEKFITQHEVTNQIILTGFINQSDISRYYSIADVFVMCSAHGETWGLTVNEAMNFKLPVIVSSLTGSADDLVRHGENGFVFTTGNVEELSQCIKTFLFKSKQDQEAMGQRSDEIISEYTFDKIIRNLKEAFDPHVHGQLTQVDAKR